MNEQEGPGVITTRDVGTTTIAKTTLLDSRTTMAYASSINDVNPRYFDDINQFYTDICYINLDYFFRI